MSARDNKAEKLQQILEEFTLRTPEALVVVAANDEGLSIASVRRNATLRQEESFAVAAARILDMANEVNKQLEQGEIGRILIEGRFRTTIVVSAGRYVTLVVVIPAYAKLGLAMLSIRRASQEIRLLYDG